LTVHSERRGRLLSLAEGKQVIAGTGPNVFYLTDFFGAGIAIVQPDKTVVVTSPLERDRAEEMCRESEVIVVKKWSEAGRVVSSMLKRRGGVADTDELQLGSSQVRVDRGLFLQARRVKDESEIDRIRIACERTNKVFESLPEALEPGRSEWQVAADVMKRATELGLVPSNSTSSLGPIIIASGPHGAYGHSELSGRKLKKGDLVVADLFFRFEGYNSDETRTFAIGSVSAEMRRHYDAVKEANEAAREMARAGVQCGAVSDAAVRVLRENGMDHLLNHGVGHGVGIDIHELPRISGGNRVELVNNDVVTDEPGVYLVGKFGIRIEDSLVVRGRSPEVLTRFTRELVTCG
jgi:Xaa-Pro aminopeptidase/Xaa-Pro dipeptidase